MNERIEEFAKQAMALAAELYGPQRAGELVWDPYTYDKKFAELIVRECMTLCNTVSDEYLALRKRTSDFGEKNIYAEGEAACDVVKYKMKTHFGVD